jgi:hypothetical protein
MNSYRHRVKVDTSDEIVEHGSVYLAAVDGCSDFISDVTSHFARFRSFAFLPSLFFAAKQRNPYFRVSSRFLERARSSGMQSHTVARYRAGVPANYPYEAFCEKEPYEAAKEKR